MPDSDTRSMTSSNENLLNPLSFVAIGFFEGSPDLACPTRLQLVEDLNKTTLGKGRKLSDPLDIKPGKYYMVLYYAEESPSVVRKDNGTERKHYECKRWHFNLGPDTATEDDGPVKVSVTFNSLDVDSVNRTEVVHVNPSEKECIPLKLVEFNSPDKLKITVVGDVHRLFAERYLKRFEGGNLKYYVNFTNNS